MHQFGARYFFKSQSAVISIVRIKAIEHLALEFFSRLIIHMKNSTLILFFLAMSFQLAAQSGGFGKEYKGGKPFRIYYFGYNIIHPGIVMGPEYDFIYATTEKVTCETGAKYVDKHLLFCPQFGFFIDTLSNFSLFVNIELDYQVIYDNCWMFEMFLSPGASLKVGNNQTSLSSELEDVLSATRGRFMPQVGLGTGYSLHKRQVNDMKLSLRILSATDDLQNGFFKPAFQLGFAYNL